MERGFPMLVKKPRLQEAESQGLHAQPGLISMRGSTNKFGAQLLDCTGVVGLSGAQAKEAE